MSNASTDWAGQILAYLAQQNGGELPAGMSAEQMRGMLEQLLGPEDGASVTGAPPMEKVLALMNRLMPAEDPNDPKVRKRRRIVEAATELFVQNGYRKTSLEDIARRAQVAKGTVYLYFKNKPELLVQAITLEKARWAPKLQAMMGADLPGRELLRRWLLTALLALHEMPLTARMLEGDREVMIALEEMDSSLHADTLKMQGQFVARLIERAARPGQFEREELEDRARVLIGVLYSGTTLLDERVRSGMSLERYAAVLVDMLVDGLLAEPRGEETP